MNSRTITYEKSFVKDDDKVDYLITIEEILGIGAINDDKGYSCVVLKVERGSINPRGRKSGKVLYSGNREDIEIFGRKAKEIFDKLHSIKECEKFLKEVNK
jgi:hypothetical protein